MAVAFCKAAVPETEPFLTINYFLFERLEKSFLPALSQQSLHTKRVDLFTDVRRGNNA